MHKPTTPTHILTIGLASALAMSSIFVMPAQAMNTDILFSNTTDPYFIDLELQFIEDMKALSIQEEDLGDMEMRDFVETGEGYEETEGDNHTHDQIVEKKATGYFRTYVSNLLGQASKNKALQDNIISHVASIEIEEINKDLESTDEVLENLSKDLDTQDTIHTNKLIKLQLTRRSLKDKEDQINDLETKSNDTLDEIKSYALLLTDTQQDLELNIESYSTHLSSLYKMQIDISDVEGEFDDLRMLSKYDSLAVSLAQHHISETVQHTLSDLLAEIQSQETKITETLVQLDLKKEEYTLQTQKLIKEKDIYISQVASFKEQIAEVQKQIEETSTLLSISQEKSATLQELIAQHHEKAPSKDFSRYFTFPVQGGISRLTSFFVDQGYVNLFGFAHYAIDIPRPQGAPTLAPAPGYVYKVFEQETSALNRFIVIHEGGFASVFLHMYSIDVEEGDYVTAGQVIGKSGGMPGTKGAGFHTTGPHLHREVWKGTKIVDPLPYTDLSRVSNSNVLQSQYSEKWKEDNTVETEEAYENHDH